MKHTYFSTFITGFSDLIPEILDQQIKTPIIDYVLDGLVVYETESSVDVIVQLPFLNNSFSLITRIEGNGGIDELITSVLHNTPSLSKEPLRGKTFRIIASKENELQKITHMKLQKLEALFAKELGLTVDRANPDTEIWFLERSEGYSFCGIRLTKKPSADKYLKKGELRPELAWILTFLSEPKATDVFLDPFAGYGSIPFARTQFEAKTIIASDMNDSRYQIPDTKYPIQKESWNATKLPLEDNSIDKIVTDPPWGMFAETNVEELYKDMMQEFTRILKPSGILVILTAQKELLEELIAEDDQLQLIKHYHILVSGKKSGVYKLQKK